MFCYTKHACEGFPLNPRGASPHTPHPRKDLRPSLPPQGGIPIPFYRSPLGRREKPLSFPSSSDSVLGASRVKVKPLRGRLRRTLTLHRAADEAAAQNP